MDLACSGFAPPAEHSLQHNAGAFHVESDLCLSGG